MSFVHTSSSSFGPKGTFIDGERVDNKYPGYRWWFDDNKTMVWVRDESDADDDEQPFHKLDTIVQVYGGPGLKRAVIAVLKGAEAKLYWRLQWLNAYRGHPDIAVPFFFARLIVSIVLSILCIGLGIVFFPVHDSLLRFLGTIIAATIVFVTALLFGSPLWRGLRTLRGFVSTYLWLKFWQFREHKSNAEIRTLFQTLSEAKDKDKAQAARMLATII